MSRARRSLSDEERILWHTVARTVKPLSGVLPPEPAAAPQAAPPEETRVESPKPAKGAAKAGAVPFLPPYVPPVSAPRPGSGIDTKTHGKIAKGSLAIDARIDLHGMTQSEAHGVLLAFVHRAHASGLRHLLVITGKGRASSGDGILRRAVPEWLRTAPFRGVVGAWASAARHHGGDGALYVRIRRGVAE